MPICVAGMHRSGTSLVARLLQMSGLDLGPPDDLLPASDSNPEGHFENRRFVEINDALLARAGGTWDEPPATFNFDDVELVDRARQLIATFREPWGWKDPRNSLTLPFWQRLIPELKTVICARHPLEVAASLQARNKFSLPMGVMLWLDYHTRLFAAAPPESRLVTHYESHFLDSRAEAERIAAFAGLSPAKDNVARADMRHSRLGLSDLLTGTLHSAPIQMYLDLCAEAGPVFHRVHHADLSALVLATPGKDFEIGELGRQLAHFKEVCEHVHRTLEDTRLKLAIRDEQMTYRRHRWANQLAEWFAKARRFLHI